MDIIVISFFPEHYVDYTGPFFLSTPEDNCEAMDMNITGTIAMVLRNNSVTCHPAKQAWFVLYAKLILLLAAASRSSWSAVCQ